MASIFTFDPDPPRVSSPWATPPAGTGTNSPALLPVGKRTPSRLGPDAEQHASAMQIPVIDNTTVTRLEAEPQEGPTEYKLHLLLKRRRSFTRFSTGLRASGSLRRGDATSSIAVNRAMTEVGALGTPPPLTSMQSRQHRLEQLTTQLLWRLQQSCPYHSSSSTAPLLPLLPDDAKLATPEMPQRLLPGLEESKGALYEIGVADDGSIVGLAEDEMDESLNNLRAMAASLGCRVQVQRMLCVGECEWVEHAGADQHIRSSKLLAAEALVSPDQHLVDNSKEAQHAADHVPASTAAPIAHGETPSSVKQLRVSLIGATMSGKSSLLGTLSTATLDNGRGKSRLSLLKHRHEIASGMTSSVTQELIGYRDVVEPDDTVSTQVISYGSGDVDAWVDIHAAVEAAQDGRLVVLSDSAGHPRFRRTTVRGIVGWQPHWTLVCVPADNTDEPSGTTGTSPSSQDIPGPPADLSQAHLQLCLDLELPLIIVITKYDLATKANLRQTLSKLLSALKEAGRKPCIISDQNPSPDPTIQHIPASDLDEASATARQLAASPLSLVPIILTSALKGTGITKLHAFLRNLPLPPPASPLPPDPPTPLFYIEDIYTTRDTPSQAILGGYLRHGRLTVGSELLLGPYPSDPASSSPSPTRSPHSDTDTSPPSPNSPEWRRVRITSLRNLRLPVRALHAGQLGTLGIAPVDGDGDGDGNEDEDAEAVRVRKGMVVLGSRGAVIAARGVGVRFSGAGRGGMWARGLGVGSGVVVFVDSVRASARVLSIGTGRCEDHAAHVHVHGGVDGFKSNSTSIPSPPSKVSVSPSPPPSSAAAQEAEQTQQTTLHLTLLTTKEFLLPGARVLLLPSGPSGAAGLSGLVGWVECVF